VAIDRVGVRKKGFLGSLDDEKPSLKVKFDEYVKGEHLYGLGRLTLNNCKQDPSLIRQCIGYSLFEEAGLAAPRCNFARVAVNGADLGNFAHVESVKKQVLRRHYESEEGHVYEGTMSDFREGWTGTFEKKTNKDDPAGEDIQALAEAIDVDDSELLSSIGPLVDLDQFYTFWATEVLIGHWDGYTANTNNFFVYHDPGSDKFEFIPWGIDNILSSGDEVPAIRSVFATGILPWRLYQIPEAQGEYVSRLEDLLATVWDEEALHAEVDRMEPLLAPYIDDDVADNMDRVRDFISSQRGVIEDELAGGPPEWTEPLREEICFEEIGELDATFSTTFGTLNVEDPFTAGTGTMSGLVEDVAIEPLAVGAVAGFDEETPDGEKSVVATVAWMPDETVLLAFVSLPTEQLQDGAVVEVDWIDTMVILMRIWPEEELDQLIGVLGGGAIEFTQASAEDDAPIVGQLSGPLVFFPF
jgi:hypothetical protein